MKISAGILTGFVLSASASTVCNKDGSATFAFESSGTEEIYDFEINDGTCSKGTGKASLAKVAVTGGFTYTYTLASDCLKDDGTNRISEITSFYSKPNRDTDMFSKKVGSTAICEFKTSYTVSLPLGDVKLTDEDTPDTPDTTDHGFVFAIEQYSDDSYTTSATETEMMTNTDLFFQIKATKSTDGYKFDVPRCTVTKDSHTYDLWRLNDGDYCIEDFSATTVTTDWKAKFEVFSFDKTGTGSYSIDCVINVCKSSTVGPCPGDSTSPPIDATCLSELD